MRAAAIIAFLSGLVLGVRVMFFGVRRVDGDLLHHRRWPLALASFLLAAGIALYARVATGEVTPAWMTAVVAVGVAAGGAAWWVVRRSAAIPSTDPEDDPRYRFQGHVARVVRSIEASGSGDRASHGRIAFSFDGKQYEFAARWVDAASFQRQGIVDSEVVIERVEGDVAYVEPWAVVEGRL